MAGRFRKCFFGYNSRQVDQAIEEITIGHSGELNRLEVGVKSLAEEKARYSGELAGLKEVGQALKESMPILEIAKGQVARSALLLVETARQNARVLLKGGREKAEINRSYIAALDQEIEKTKSEFELLLQSAENILKSGRFTDKTIKEIGAASEKVVGAIISSEEKKRSFLYEVRESAKNNIPNESVIPAAAVVAFRKDGPIVQNSLIVSERLETTEELEAMKTVGSEAQRQEPPAGEAPLIQPEIESAPFIQPESELEQKGQKKPEEDSLPVASERTKYIIGKLSGKDVLDGEGSLIIGRGDVITAEKLERVEKSGKLAELIVHMVIPGLDLDEAL